MSIAKMLNLKPLPVLRCLKMKAYCLVNVQVELALHALPAEWM